MFKLKQDLQALAEKAEAGRRGRFCSLLGCILLVCNVTAQIAPNSPTTFWVPLAYGNANFPDAARDQQTGSGEVDLVGNLSHPSLYMNYQGSSPTSGWLAFRFRVAEDASPLGFKGAAFVGLDADLDGDLDLFLGVNNQGSSDFVGLWNPGASLNNAPANTSVANPPLRSYSITASIYDFSPVSAATDPVAISYDLDGGGRTDRFLSFLVPLADVSIALAARGISDFTANSPLQLMAATGSQGNNFNGDLNGIVGGNSSGVSWSQLGGFTRTYSFDSVTPIPEPNSAFLLSIAGGFFFLIMARRRAQF